MLNSPKFQSNGALEGEQNQTDQEEQSSQQVDESKDGLELEGKPDSPGKRREPQRSLPCLLNVFKSLLVLQYVTGQ